MVKTFPFLRLCDNGVVETFDREELAKLRGHKSHMEYEEFLEKANQISFSDSSIAIYNSFREQVYSPQSVLYSSCGYDASPAKVFENVTFVDIEEGCVKKLQEAGLHALKQNIKTYIPKDLHDLLILLCPATPPGWATRHLKPGGYVIADEWHQTATNIYRQPQKFTLLGTIDVKRDKSVVISRNLDDLFEPVKD